MPAAFVRVARQGCNPGSSGSYVDVDMDSYGIDADAVGVWLLFDSPTTSSFVDVRKNGSTDTWRYAYLMAAMQSMVCVGIDANGIAEIKLSAYYYVDPYCMGYLMDPVTMFTNATDKSTTTTNSYVDVDVSSECPSATMCFVGLDNTVAATAARHFIRKNGSSDDRYTDADVRAFDNCGHIIGLDGSQVFEQKIESSTNDCYIQGYYDGSAVTMHTNATDRSLGSTGSWTDLTALPSGALAGFYSIHNTEANINYGAIRKNGTADDPYLGGMFTDTWESSWIVECDGSRLVEGKIDDTLVDFYELGYAAGEGASAFPQMIVSS